MHLRIDWRGGWSQVALALGFILFFETRARAAEEKRATASAEANSRPDQTQQAGPSPEIADIVTALRARAEAIALFANDATVMQGERELAASSKRLSASSAKLLEDTRASR